MQLYAGTSEDFIDIATQHRIAEKIGDAFYDYYRFRAAASEFNAWRNSLTALAAQFRYSGVHDHGVVVEMQLPSSSARLDCLVFGKSRAAAASGVLIELKQWTEAGPSDWDECVEAFVGGRVRALLHPSVQAQHYADYLQDANSAFDPDAADAVALHPCSWLHNMHPGSAGVLRSSAFSSTLERAPLFVGADADRFGAFLDEHVGLGEGVPIMQRALNGRHAPSLRLLEHTAELIAGESSYHLIDDQVVAYQAVLAMVRRAQKHKGEKAVVLIKGGPGTGKSLIALNLLGTLSRRGVNAHHATGSKAFTENLWRVLGHRSRAHVRYFHSFIDAEPGAIDVLIADEAHRIRETSNSRYTPKARRSQRLQLEELVEASKVSVFFIDDNQSVRPGEIGSSALIRETAMRIGARFEQVDLRTQFRCAGSDEYIDWIDQLLEVRKTGQLELAPEGFDFKLVDSPLVLDELIRLRLQEGSGARLMAGYCWKWSDPDEDGRLVDDVKIGPFQRPWNAKPDARRLARGIPKAQFWASDPGGVDQVGCVYTAQGFEFDYAGVIWGEDLVYRGGEWVGQRAVSHDTVVKRAGPRFVDCVKNTYRVLLTRGLRGCYLCILDEETRAHVTSRMLATG